MHPRRGKPDNPKFSDFHGDAPRTVRGHRFSGRAGRVGDGPRCQRGRETGQ